MLVGLVLLLMAIRGAADDGLGVVEWSGAVWNFTSSQPVWIVFAVAGLFLLTVDLWAPHLLPHFGDTTTDEAPFKSGSPDTEAAAPPQDQARVFVPPNVTPEYLVGLFDDRTDVQAKTLVDPYIGKWMTVSGPLGNVGTRNDYFAQVTFQNKGMFEEGTRFEIHGVVFMYFRDPRSDERLAMLRPGTEITVVGRLERVTGIDVHLDDCELID
jgi:hypothetical protein